MMLFATFAAPPRRKDSRTTSTTGTGASGEILLTLPKIYRSSIMSPMMRIFLFLNELMIFEKAMFQNTREGFEKSMTTPAVARTGRNALGYNVVSGVLMISAPTADVIIQE
jgi:hypothetical protein